LSESDAKDASLLLHDRVFRGEDVGIEPRGIVFRGPVAVDKGHRVVLSVAAGQEAELVPADSEDGRVGARELAQRLLARSAGRVHEVVGGTPERDPEEDEVGLGKDERGLVGHLE
jgi:hypothetical protein